MKVEIFHPTSCLMMGKKNKYKNKNKKLIKIKKNTLHIFFYLSGIFMKSQLASFQPPSWKASLLAKFEFNCHALFCNLAIRHISLCHDNISILTPSFTYSNLLACLSNFIYLLFSSSAVGSSVLDERRKRRSQIRGQKVFLTKKLWQVIEFAMLF